MFGTSSAGSPRRTRGRERERNLLEQETTHSSQEDGGWPSSPASTGNDVPKDLDRLLDKYTRRRGKEKKATVSARLVPIFLFQTGTLEDVKMV